MNTIVFHPWASLAADTDNPVELRIDLDPQPGTDFADAAAVAPALRDVLAEAGLTAFVKTSGNRGIHVFCPIEPTHEFLDVRHAVIAAGARARAADARQGHDELVEGGARRAHLHRLQPGQPRPHDGRRLQPARAARRDRVDSGDLGRARAASIPRPSRCAPCRSGSPTSATRGRRCSTKPGTHRHAAGVVGARPVERARRAPFPPDFPKMPGEPPRVQPSRNNPENWTDDGQAR